MIGRHDAGLAGQGSEHLEPDALSDGLTSIQRQL
jgi:hypothetical protein